MIIDPFVAQHAAGFNIIDCEVRTRSILCLLLRRDYTQDEGWSDSREPPPEGKLQKRLLFLQPENPEGRKWGVMRLDGLNRSRCALATKPTPKLVVIDSNAVAWAQDPNSNGFEPAIPPAFQGGLLSGAITRARSFGEHLLISTTARQVLRRLEPGVWDLVGPRMPYEFKSETISDYGFHDFDQFSPTDLYAAGGAGDIWHFNGSIWRQCAFPTNWGLSAVCCAGDGQVYVAASVVIYRGQGDRWTRLKTKGPKMSIPIKDLVWYEDKLWATSDYGIWTLEGDTLVEADLPSEVKVCAGNLAVRDGVMLLAGYGGAAFRRDGQWTVIFHDYELREMAKKS
jgi:hypothetical protein